MARSIFTFSDIERLRKSSVTASVLVEKASKANVYGSTFLSYSSVDGDYLDGVISVLEGHGTTVYIDKKDSSLPSTPNAETAKILRSNIENSRKFVLFVIPNSKLSKWIPWELGLADGEKTSAKVALFPVAQYNWETEWSEQEYLGLYNRILWTKFEGENNHCWAVCEPTEKIATKLSEWLTR